MSPEQQLEEERRERYEKLMYMATKGLHKEAKIVKSFECQKIVRKLKQQPSSTLDEQRLAHIKAFSLDAVTRVCLMRLGMFNLNPLQESVVDEAVLSKEDEELVERMLRHKRMVTAMETWNDKVTEYRRWLLRRQERVSDLPDFIKESSNSKQASTKRGADGGGQFVCLGGTSMEEDGELGYYGPGGADQDDEYASIVKKKNRPGQRSRKAKTLAIQAKKEGRKWDSSLNWREKKSAPKEEEAKEASTKPVAPAKAADIATMGKTWKEEGKEHPSWAARKQSKNAGIVAFTGKKITFD